MKLKFSFSILTTFLAVLLLFPTNLFTAENLNKNLKIDHFKEYLLQELKKEHPNAQFIDLSEEEAAKLQKQSEQSTESVSLMAAAPPLTLLEVVAAVSSNYPTYEFFSMNQLSSIQDHGGAELYIVTEEHGYGQARVLKMSGRTLKEHSYQAFDLNGDYIIDGYYRWWDASGLQSGTFSYQSTAINSPWNTMYDSIYIK